MNLFNGFKSLTTATTEKNDPKVLWKVQCILFNNEMKKKKRERERHKKIDT